MGIFAWNVLLERTWNNLEEKKNMLTEPKKTKVEFSVACCNSPVTLLEGYTISPRIDDSSTCLLILHFFFFAQLQHQSELCNNCNGPVLLKVLAKRKSTFPTHFIFFFSFPKSQSHLLMSPNRRTHRKQQLRVQKKTYLSLPIFFWCVCVCVSPGKLPSNEKVLTMMTGPDVPLSLLAKKVLFFHELS